MAALSEGQHDFEQESRRHTKVQPEAFLGMISLELYGSSRELT